MELVEQLDLRRAHFELFWKPREENTLADALSNMEFNAFKQLNRVQVEPLMRWVVLGDLLAAGPLESPAASSRPVPRKNRGSKRNAAWQ